MRVRNPISAREHGEYTWCAACERVDRTAAWDVGIWRCPHCSGIARDARPWEDVCRLHSDYPLQPQPGCRYLWEGEAPPEEEEPSPRAPAEAAAEPRAPGTARR